MWKGIVDTIFIASAASEPMEEREEVRAVPEKGLEDDRYFLGTGHWDSKPEWVKLNPCSEVTLIENESIEALKTPELFKKTESIHLAPGAHRRNIVTRGVPLNHMIGKVFQAGEVTLQGVAFCEPCSHMEDLSQKGVLYGLVHRGGLKAKILTEGLIRKGDAVREAAPAP